MNGQALADAGGMTLGETNLKANTPDRYQLVTLPVLALGGQRIDCALPAAGLLVGQGPADT